MSNRVAVFNDGVIQQLAPPDELYERPDNAFVAQFIGENNTLVGDIKEISGNTATVDVNGSIIKALNVNTNGTGSKTTLSIRPERVAINPSNEGDYQNVFKASIKELIYLCDHIRTRASVCGDDEFVVKIANASALSSLKVGTEVIRESISPIILAVATILICISIMLLATVELLRRRSERLRGMSPG